MGHSSPDSVGGGFFIWGFHMFIKTEQGWKRLGGEFTWNASNDHLDWGTDKWREREEERAFVREMTSDYEADLNS